jgi:hypothetical protein
MSTTVNSVSVRGIDSYVVRVDDRPRDCRVTTTQTKIRPGSIRLGEERQEQVALRDGEIYVCATLRLFSVLPRYDVRLWGSGEGMYLGQGPTAQAAHELAQAKLAALIEGVEELVDLRPAY